MLGIIFEGVLFLALLAAAGALLWAALVRWTPFGQRMAQARNRDRIEELTGLMCPVHGRHEPYQLVRLPDGEVMCPRCYEEAMNAH